MTLNQRKGEMSYEERCHPSPGLSGLLYLIIELIYLWSNVFGYHYLDFEDFIEFTTTKSTTANHSYKLYVKSTRLNCYKHYFFTRIATLWNDLPKDIVEADSLHLFKSKRKTLSQCLTKN